MHGRRLLIGGADRRICSALQRFWRGPAPPASTRRATVGMRNLFPSAQPFDGATDSQDGSLIERPSDDLDRQWQAISAKTDWNGHRWVTGEIEGARLQWPRRRMCQRVETRCGRQAYRGDQPIVSCENLVDFGDQSATQAKRVEIFRGSDRDVRRRIAWR